MIAVAPEMRAADRRFLKQMQDRFQRRLTGALKKRDWADVEHQFLVYGMWLETELDTQEEETSDV